MKRVIQHTTWLIAPALFLLLGSRSLAAANGVRDDAHFFSADAISQAERIIRQIDQKHNKDVLVETFPEIPADQKSQFDQLGKDAFFRQFAAGRGQLQGVNGVYILINRNPAHLEVAVGNRTQQRLFRRDDRDAVRDQLVTAFRGKQYDQGLVQAMQLIAGRMDSNAQQAGSGAMAPGGMPTRGNGPVFPSQQRGWSFGSMACVLIAVVLFVIFIRGIFGRSGGGSYYGGGFGGYPQQGGYPQGGYPQGGYPPQGGYGFGGGGGGGGFGRGFLGGLLGGAVGGYAAEKWMGQGQQGGGPGFAPPAAGGGGDFSSGPDTSFDSSGGDFGGGGGGADFGGGGGGDSGGGGGDF